MKASYKRELTNTYLMIEEDEAYREDYQIRMIEENDIEGLLDLSVRGVDEKSQFLYNVQGKTPLITYFKGKQLKAEELSDFLQQLIRVLQRVESYMLDPNCVLMNPAYIFNENDTYQFCYFPPCTLNLHVSFHELTEYLVGELDFADKEGIYIAYELHKRTMQEHYVIERVLDGILESREEKIKAIYGRVEIKETPGLFDLPNLTEVPICEAYATLPKPKKSKENLKKTCLGIFNRKKKTKWEDWDAFASEMNQEEN